jgi:hypothetical protein
VGLVISNYRSIGRLVIRDNREDGCTLLLITEDGGAIALQPEREEQPPAAAESLWLHHVKKALHLEDDETFELVLDTSDLPARPMRFLFEPFVTRALDTAWEEEGRGEKLIRLSDFERFEWGYYSPPA